MNDLIKENKEGKIDHLKERLTSEINFFNKLNSIYTQYPEGYNELIKRSKREIELLISQLNEIYK